MVESDGSPRDAVFTTAAWDGAGFIADWKLHFARMQRHAARLRIQIPNNFQQQVARLVSRLSRDATKTNLTKTPNSLLRIECSSKGEIGIESRSILLRDEQIDAITLPAPRWGKKINGTKHGAWQPYHDARAIAEKKGVDLALLVHDYAIIDADRATPVVLDEDGTAWISAVDAGGAESITMAVLSPMLEQHGIPLNHGRLNERIVARAAEIIAVGSGIGVCQITSIDGDDVGGDSTLSTLCKAALKEHYGKVSTWTKLEV